MTTVKGLHKNRLGHFATDDARGVTVIHKDELAADARDARHRSIVLQTGDTFTSENVGEELASIIEQRRREDVYRRLGWGVCRRLWAKLCPGRAADLVPKQQASLTREESRPGAESIFTEEGGVAKVDRARKPTLSQAFVGAELFAAPSPSARARKRATAEEYLRTVDVPPGLRRIPSLAGLFDAMPTGGGGRTPDQVRQRQLATGGLRATNGLALGSLGESGGRSGPTQPRGGPFAAGYGRTVAPRRARPRGRSLGRSNSAQNVLSSGVKLSPRPAPKKAAPAVHSKEDVAKVQEMMEMPFWDIAEEDDFVASAPRVDQA